MVKLKIDGKMVNARTNETVLEAARRAGIKIPTLCYHPELEPYGGCRLCIVEVKGIKNPLTACTLPVKSGMEIKTNTSKLKNLRRFTLQLILSEHPQACLFCQKKDECREYQHCIEKVSITTGCKFCPKNERCELQKVIDEVGIKEIDYPGEYRALEVERFDPFFDRDYNLCILCGRCTRVCQDLRGVATLDFHHRGPKTSVGTAFGLSHLETNCQFCGACVDVCPTGALADRFSRYQGVPERSARTTCILCNLACSVKVNINKDEIVGIEPVNDPLCVRGRFGIAPLAGHPKRARYPYVKIDNRLKRVQWSIALDQAAGELTKHKGRIGIVFSPQITIEAIDKLIVLAKGLNAPIAPTQNLNGYVQNKIKNIAHDACFIVVNTDLMTDFSPLLLRLRKQASDAKMIVIDNIKSEFADRADVFIQVAPGTEVKAVNEILQTGFDRWQIIDKKSKKECQDACNGRKLYLIYNPANVTGFRPSGKLALIPIVTAVNAAYLRKYEFSRVGDLLNSTAVDCLYVIGRVPNLNRRYATVIAQDCFVPDAEPDVFLPAAMFTESEGRIIDDAGKIKKLKPLVSLKSESRSDAFIISALIDKLDIKPSIVNRQELPRIKMHKGGRKHKIANGWYMIVRENCHTYRNQRLSSLLKGFARIRNDGYIQINPAEAKQLGVKEGGMVRVVGSDFCIEGAVSLSENIPLRSLMMLNADNYPGLCSQIVGLECIK